MPRGMPPTITEMRTYSENDHKKLLSYGMNVLSLTSSNRIIAEILQGEVPPTYDWEEAME